MPYKDISKRKEYHKQYHKVWYKKNGVKRRKQVMERKREIKKWFKKFKKTLKCSQCSESDAACLDFHHLDPKKHDDYISNMIRDGRSKAIILKEISKCIVLCSNCHRKLHYRESSKR